MLSSLRNEDEAGNSIGKLCIHTHTHAKCRNVNTDIKISTLVDGFQRIDSFRENSWASVDQRLRRQYPKYSIGRLKNRKHKRRGEKEVIERSQRRTAEGRDIGRI